MWWEKGRVFPASWSMGRALHSYLTWGRESARQSCFIGVLAASLAGDWWRGSCHAGLRHVKDPASHPAVLAGSTPLKSSAYSDVYCKGDSGHGQVCIVSLLVI